MTFGSFLKLVEIQTKAASMTPFLLGSIFVIYRYEHFSPMRFFFMLVSLLAFDMATTAINNYMDFKKANKTHGYGYESHNAIVRDRLGETVVRITILLLLAAAVIFGWLLFLHTSPVILAVGALSFAVGVLYSFGPVPISRMPLGELFSGFFMGFVILFLSVYIHLVDLQLAELVFTEGRLVLSLQVYEVIVLFIVALPATLGISNIMLANNICDMEEDLENRRYTLPIYIGRERALSLFQMLYYIAFGDILLLILLGILPPVAALALITLLPVRRHLSAFKALQTKKDTFILSVKNFLLINGALIVLLLLGVLFF